MLSVVGFTEDMLDVDDECLLFDESLPTPDKVFIPPESTVCTWKRFPSHRRALMEAKRVLKAKKRSQDLAAQKRLALSEDQTTSTPATSPFTKPFLTVPDDDSTTATQSFDNGSTEASTAPPSDDPHTLEPIPVEVESILLNATKMKLLVEDEKSSDPRVHPLPPAPDKDSYYSSTLASWIPKSSARRREARARLEEKEEALLNQEDANFLAKGKKIEKRLLASGALSPEVVQQASALDDSAATLLKKRRQVSRMLEEKAEAARREKETRRAAAESQTTATEETNPIHHQP